MLNNKGFAISTILYSLLMMATLILFLLIGNLSFERRTTNNLANNIKDELNSFVNGGDSLTGAVLSNVKLNYQVYITGTGWDDPKTDGETAGTTSQSRAIQALKISVENKGPLTGDIEYRAHMQTYGWQNYVKNGSLAGLDDEQKRLEAFQIRLTGDLAKYFDIEYRAHVQNDGWQSYVKNGATAGTIGKSYRIEAIEIRLVRK